MLSLVDIACERGERKLFSGLSLTLEPGDMLVLRGSNGAGKSSLLRILAMLLSPSDGRILWRDEDVAEDPDVHRRRVRYVGHLDALKNVLTVQENLRSYGRIQGSDLTNVGPAMEALGVGRLRHLPARYLSAGQRRRTALARLIMAPAPLWLLDEPTVGLDDDGVDRLQRVIERQRDGGGIVIAATHIDMRLADTRTLRLGQS